MKARIRVGALIFEKGKILLIKHVNPVNGEEFWVTPGGGIKKEDETIYSCAKRETFEECGLEIKLFKNIKFIREWYDEEKEKIQLELFLLAKSYKGKLSMKNLKGLGADEEWIKGFKFLSEKEMENLKVFPEFLKKPKKLLKKMKNGAIYIK